MWSQLDVVSQVSRVYYPGLTSHPDHEAAKRLFGAKGYSGMVSIEIEGGLQSGIRFVEVMSL